MDLYETAIFKEQLELSFMHKKYKLTVNDQYEFQLTAADLASLDVVRTGSHSQHLLDKYQSHNINFDKKDFQNKKYRVHVNNNKYEVSIADSLDLLIDAMGFELGSSANVSSIEAPMPGLILEVSVTEGKEVREGEALLILEAMKMENVITSPRAGTIGKIEVKQGEAVEKKQILLTFE